MQTNYAVHSATNTIDIVLQKGAQKLYDQYLNHKLPGHTHNQNGAMITSNLNLHNVPKPALSSIESVPFCFVQTAAIDTHVPKRVPVNKYRDNSSTLSPKNTTLCKSTKYQTLLSGPRSSLTRQQIQQHSNSLLSEEGPRDTGTKFKEGRPMTMQTDRSKRDSNLLGQESKLEEVEEKRAATCHTRKRRQYVSCKDKVSQMVKIKDEDLFLVQEDAEVANRFKAYKKHKMEEDMQKEQELAKVEAYYRMKQTRTKDSFEEVKNNLKGKSKVTPPITNFQTIDGHVLINGKPKQQRTHIIQLQFNPEEERTLKSQETRVMGVNSTKKIAFVSKIKKKLKITNEQYTNNGSRQVSSIPFVSLSCGIALSQKFLDATASRRRPAEEITREQFTSENSSNRFKSHIPIVNTARLNKMYATVEHGSKTARSEVFQPNNMTLSCERKDIETTYASARQMPDSLLWKARPKSQTRSIRISNREVYQEQFLEMKLVH